MELPVLEVDTMGVAAEEKQVVTVGVCLAAMALVVGLVDLVVPADRATVVMVAMAVPVVSEVALVARLAGTTVPPETVAKVVGPMKMTIKEKEREKVRFGEAPAVVSRAVARRVVLAVTTRVGVVTGRVLLLGGRLEATGCKDSPMRCSYKC